MKPYLENVVMPDGQFPIKGFVTSTMEHVIQVHPHWHAEVEILYYMDGSALQQVNDSIFTAGPGDIVIIGRDQLHSTYHSGNGSCRILVLQFNADAMLPPAAESGMALARPGFANETVYGNPIKTSNAEGMRLLQCIEEIADELGRRAAAYDLIVKSAVCRLAGLLARYGMYTIKPGSPDGVKCIHTMLERTFKLVDESFAEDISLEDAALASNLSTTHFCRLFKKTTGMTFHEYLTFYRINRAEKMLSPSKRLTDIAFECGFGSITSFIRNFKKYKDCAPSRYLTEATQKDGAGNGVGPQS